MSTGAPWSSRCVHFSLRFLVGEIIIMRCYTLLPRIALGSDLRWPENSAGSHLLAAHRRPTGPPNRGVPKTA